MNVNKTIIDALKPLGHPVKPNVYTGDMVNGVLEKKETYIIFNYVDDRAAEFADDEAQTDIASMRINLYTPNNYMTLKKQIRIALRKAGFTYPIVIPLFENDTKLNHIVFECEIDGDSEREE